MGQSPGTSAVDFLRHSTIVRDIEQTLEKNTINVMTFLWADIMKIRPIR